jgi:hypothetical protein
MLQDWADQKDKAQAVVCELGNCEFPPDVLSCELTISVYIWGSDGNESDQDPSERTRWLGKILAIRAAAKDKVFM